MLFHLPAHNKVFLDMNNIFKDVNVFINI